MVKIILFSKANKLKSVLCLVVMISLIITLGCGRKETPLPAARTEIDRAGLSQISRICVLTFAAPVRRTYHKGTFPHLINTLLAEYFNLFSHQIKKKYIVELLPIETAEKSEFYRLLRDKQDLGVYPSKDRTIVFSETAKLFSYSAANPFGIVSFRLTGEKKEWTSADSSLIVIDISEPHTVQEIAEEINANGFLSVRSAYDIDITWSAPSITVRTVVELYDNDGKVIWKTTQPLEYRKILPLNWFRCLWMGSHKSVMFINLTEGERKYVLKAINSASVSLHDQMAKSISNALNNDISESRTGL